MGHHLKLRPGKHHHGDADTLCPGALQVWEVVVGEPVTKAILEDLAQSILETELTLDVVKMNASQTSVVQKIRQPHPGGIDDHLRRVACMESSEVILKTMTSSR